MSLSAQQQAIVNEGENGNSSMLIEALAGTGKTFTLLKLLAVLKGSSALTAFNYKIAQELDEKVNKEGLKANVGTCHSYGFQAIRKAMPKVKIEGKGKDRAGFYKMDRIVTDLEIEPKMQRFVKEAISLAKQRAIGFLCPLNDPQAWLSLVSHYSLDELLFQTDDNNQYGKNEEIDPIERELYTKRALQVACKGLKMSIDLTVKEKVIDFDDMIYIPLILKMHVQQYDNVLVDEAQDTNPARRALVKKMLKPGGRAIFVGDGNQAIYGFTGADNDSLEIIKREFGCKTFPLTMTYRCAKAVVSVAQQFVPSYEAFHTNKDGSYEMINDDDFTAMMPELTPGEDAILCRNTKPLVDTAFRLIRQGIACRVEGKDIGKDLIRLIKKYERRCETMADMIECLEAYRNEETETLMAQGKEMAAESLNDRVDTILAIISYLSRNAEVADLINKIDEMFEDTPENENPKTKVILMTIHRSKGLEFKRVFLYGRNKFCPSRYARQAWQFQQERNLEYVGITRAIETLIDVTVF